MNSKLFTIAGLLLLLGTAVAMYEETDKVVVLTASNFNEEVIESEKLWFVEFYAPWCGHCKNLAPEWKKLAIGLEGLIGVGAVDMTVEGSVGQPYNIQGYPTIKFFGADKTKPIDYDGGRSFDDLLGWALDQIGKHATNKGSPGTAYDAKNEKKEEEEIDEGDPKDVVVLTEESFEEEVMGGKDAWFIEFVAPWCGHCKKLAPEWNRMATNLVGQLKVGKVNCVEHRTLCDKYAVKGYPTIKFFASGEKTEDKIIDYGEGSRSSGVLESWALEKKILYEPAKFDQLISEEVFKSYCREAKGICLIAFLPHIYDTTKEERNSYLDVLKELAEKYKGKPANFLWSQGGDQFPLEDALNLGSGYPTVVALSLKKNVYAVMRGRFQKEGIDSFVTSIIGGRSVGVSKLPGGYEILKNDPWDGENKKPEIHEEEIDACDDPVD